jgi:hypothetical protein
MLDAQIPPRPRYSSTPFASPDRLFKIDWDGTRRRRILREGRLAPPTRPGLPRGRDLTRLKPEPTGEVSFREEAARGPCRAAALLGWAP